MIVAAMQPYFFPYIGYFQLIHAADAFIFLDDVQYIQRGWVNRNRVNHDTRWIWLTHAVEKASRSSPINARHYIEHGDNSAPDLLRKIEQLYKKSQYFDEAINILRPLIGSGERNVATYNCQHVTALCKELGINTKLFTSSELSNKRALKGQERIIDLCSTIGADTYINPIGGMEIYQSDRFEKFNIQLKFLRTEQATRNLLPEPSHLSIIDTIMTDGISCARRSLSSHEFIQPHR